MQRFALLLTLIAGACAEPEPPTQKRPGAFVVVLGIAQDAGYPQAACKKPCCAEAWKDPSKRRRVASLAIVINDKRWLIDCTPDFRDQLRALDELAPVDDRSPGLDGIFLTHAHIGHYVGLVHLGREVIGADAVPVYAMPRLRDFLTRAGPWSLIVSKSHIQLEPIEHDRPFALTKDVSIRPLLVPHRDEFSETVGFVIRSKGTAILYIPDIDKWDRWDRNIEDEIAKVDIAYLDGTFFQNGEIPGRDMSQIQHPFIEETLTRLGALPKSERAKVRFIHLNHTNPALDPKSTAARRIRQAGFDVARQGETVELRLR